MNEFFFRVWDNWGHYGFMFLVSYSTTLDGFSCTELVVHGSVKYLFSILGQIHPNDAYYLLRKLDCYTTLERDVDERSNLGSLWYSRAF